MSDVLVIGRNLLLGAQIVGKLLGGTDHYVTWLIENLDSHIAEELNALIFKKIESHKPSGLKGSLRSRLALLEWEPDVEGNIRADEMWLLEGKDAWPALTAKEKEESALVRSLRILESSGARMLSYVASIYDCDCVVPGILPELSIREQRIAAFCKARDIAAHFFLTSWLIGEDYVSSDSGEEVHCLLHALDEVIAEIQERTPEYFDFKPLRVVAARDAAVNLLHMASAVDFMLGASAKHAGADLRQIVVSAQDTPWQDFCEQLGEAYGVSMLSVEAPDELNAIDRLLGQRLSELQSAWSGENVVCFHSSELPNGLIVDREMQIEFLNAVRRKQEQERTARDERVSALPDKWRKKVVPVNAGELTYYLAGTEGEYVLILNALGQPLDYWHRLVDVLMRRSRVIIWETRGLSESEALRLDDHLSDIDAVLREERIDSCHLVGWCTGPQVAVEFYVRRPAAVLDMIFLSCAFKVAGHPELETAYGWNLEGLCRAMIDNPAMTASIRRSLSKPASSDINLDDKDAKQLSAQVLLLTNKNLRTCVLAPFQTETSTFNYARQILLLAATPTLEYAKRVQVPVLVIGCECDQVAAAAKSSAVARLFTTSRHVELPGATHYSFYDRPKLVAGMMQSFFREGRVAATLETLAVGAGQ